MSKFCPSCMGEVPDYAQGCPLCGSNLHLQNRPHQLPVNTILDGHYLIGKVLGEGGFGITYIGLDLRLRERVAIKEYYPSTISNRLCNYSLDITATSDQGEVQLKKGRQRFLEEAQILARFRDEPSIVNVYDYFNANNTGYIVMEYLDGENLNQYFRREGPIRDFDQLYALLRPVMEGLEKIHQAGLIHRDISPSNLMLLKSGKVKLLDFGTVRQISAEGELSLSVALKPGFAPVEQYQSHGRQGPWTDVYALCATIYKLMTGRTPYEQPERKGPLNPMDMGPSSVLVPPSQLGARISNIQEETLLQGLRERPEDRVQSITELMQGFDRKGGTPVEDTDLPHEPKVDAPTDPVRPDPVRTDGNGQSGSSSTEPAKKSGRWNWGDILIALLVVAAFSYFLLTKTVDHPIGHTHSWVSATCTEPKTCSSCGETEGSALGHRWVDADYRQPKTCSVCGVTEGKPLPISGRWSDKPYPFDITNSYYLILDQTLYDLKGITLHCSVEVEKGDCGKNWYLRGLCADGKWVILGEFTMGEDGMNNILEEHEFWLKESMDLCAVTLTPKTYGGALSYHFTLKLLDPVF